MKKAVLLFAVLAISLSGFSQDGDKIFIGVKDTLYSSILDENREIWVSVPSDVRSYLKGQEFPVVVVLDGPDHFYSVVGMVDRFSNNASNEICPPMIVVGLVNTDRFRDFYPELPDDNFTLFLKDELLPYIDENYPTKPYRILIGHSYDNYYKSISEKLGYEVKSLFDDSMLIGYLDYKQWYEKALAVAKYNATIHPENEKAKEWIEKLENKIPIK